MRTHLRSGQLIVVSLYTQLTADNVFDVLFMADMYLLPGLKRICGKSLAQAVCKDNVVQMWKVAKLFQLSRLEDYCTEYMAKIIDQVSTSVSTLDDDYQLWIM